MRRQGRQSGSFLKKKLLSLGVSEADACVSAVRDSRRKSFLVLFFKKNRLLHFCRTNPSCATLATNRPSRLNTCPRLNPLAPPAHGESVT